MPILSVYIGPETEKFLKEQAEKLGRTVEDLAECAVAEYCLSIANRQQWNRS